VSIYASKQKQLQKSKSIGISVIINNNDGENLYLSINSLILNRWSPMAMTGEELADEELMSLFEAARWAISGYKWPALEVRLRKENIQYWMGYLISWLTSTKAEPRTRQRWS
jgi:hypothetical protein